jgi:hypothetical protein
MQGRKPTRSEWKIFEYNGLNSKEWLVQKATISYLQIINKKTGEETFIHIQGEQ